MESVFELILENIFCNGVIGIGKIRGKKKSNAKIYN